MTDTGVVFDRSFSDYNRKYAVANVSKNVISSWSRLQEATEARKELFLPGNAANKVFQQ